jgi:hypothetical protein
MTTGAGSEGQKINKQINWELTELMKCLHSQVTSSYAASTSALPWWQQKCVNVEGQKVIALWFWHGYEIFIKIKSRFLATDPEVLGSIPGASRFPEKQWVWNGVHSASWGQLRSYLEEIVAALVKKTETNDWRDPLCWPRNTLSAKVGTTSPTSGGRSVGIVR